MKSRTWMWMTVVYLLSRSTTVRLKVEENQLVEGPGNATRRPRRRHGDSP